MPLQVPAYLLQRLRPGPLVGHWVVCLPCPSPLMGLCPCLSSFCLRPSRPPYALSFGVGLSFTLAPAVLFVPLGGWYLVP